MVAVQKLLVSDIFRSIQGEGPKTGIPSIFLRLGGCNLQCTWCDTPYTWKKGFTDYIEQSFDEIKTRIIDAIGDEKVKNLVITGGEPLLQQAMLAEFLADPLLQKFEIEFETNGSLPLTSKMQELIATRNGLAAMGSGVGKISFNISPKLSDSGNKPYSVNLYPESVLKFVYVSEQTEQLIDEFLANNKIDSREVFIMSEGTSVEKMSQKYNTLLAYCYRKGFRFCPRVHIYLFGDQRAT